MLSCKSYNIETSYKKVNSCALRLNFLHHKQLYSITERCKEYIDYGLLLVAQKSNYPVMGIRDLTERTSTEMRILGADYHNQTETIGLYFKLHMNQLLHYSL